MALFLIYRSVIRDDKSTYNDGDVNVKEAYGGKTLGRTGGMTLLEIETDAKQVLIEMSLS
jgi:uncharacterized protein (DUF1330 family)